MAKQARRKSGERKRKTSKAELRDQDESRKSLWLTLTAWRKSPWVQELASVFFVVLALFLAASFVSHKLWLTELSTEPLLGTDIAGRNWMGPVGHVTGTLLAGSFGWCGLLPTIWLLGLALITWLRLPEANQKEHLLGGVTVWSILFGIMASTTALAALCAIFGGEVAGGKVGTQLATSVMHYVNIGGALLIWSSALLLSLAVTLKCSTLEIAEQSLRLTGATLKTGITVLPLLVVGLVSRIVWGLQEVLDLLSFRQRQEIDVDEPLFKPRRRSNYLENDADEEDEELEDEEEEIEEGEEEDLVTEIVVRRHPNGATNIGSRKRRSEYKRPSTLPDPAYVPPDLELLTKGEVIENLEDDTVLRNKSRLIEDKLRDFNIAGRVTQVHPGPVITLFEFEPAAGVKVGRIAALQDDLAMGLRASSIRIIAPIPGRGTVGIEVPNEQRELVRLRDVLESEESLTATSVLSVPIGKDIYGAPLVIDIAKMPHLLMAGATGSGKSISINAVLVSLLYRSSPAELGLILIDPKILELSVYEGIPHLKVPVVTHPRQARAVLQWAVREMERRYRLMQRYGVRGIDGFNRIARGEGDDATLASTVKGDVVELEEEHAIEELTEEELALETNDEEESEPTLVPVEELQPLEKIVIVIDELADLMLTVGREIEELITRLAQKARAAGIHLIVATQRPSVDVITGLIKANFPARLSFRVSSRIDSRTILDASGADKLLGRGDMLLMLPGAEHVMRAHGAFVSDTEVTRVVQAVSASSTPHYDDEIVAICEEALLDDEQSGGRDGDSGAEEYDALYDEAVELVVRKGQASTSMIQRAFRIGYNRAARIIDLMESEGVVGPTQGSKPREVLLESSE